MVALFQPFQHGPLLLVSAEGQRLGHTQGYLPLADFRPGLVAQGRQRQPPLDGTLGHTGPGGHVGHGRALGHKGGEGLGLVHGVQLLALHVLDGGQPQGVGGGQALPDVHRHGEVGGDVAALRQQLQGAVAALAGHDVVAPALTGSDNEVLQKPVRGDGSGQPFEGDGVNRPARVGLGRVQLVEGDGFDGHGLTPFGLS